jgi:2-polyprenyl-3-methyl-5-hydroxy-6-metoxy-1,4-benzoquinol methylase
MILYCRQFSNWSIVRVKTGVSHITQTHESLRHNADDAKPDDVSACYVCRSEDVRLHGNANGFDVYKCRRCKLLWVDCESYGTRIRDFYSESYFTSESQMGYNNYAFFEDIHRENAREILKVLDKVKDISRLRVLDVGCACGFYLDEFKKRKGCSTYGVEVSDYAAERASRLGLNVTGGEFNTSMFEADFFDAAFLIGTVEHLTDPRKVLKDISTVLKPGGLLMITTIDTKGLIPIYAIKPPEHLYYFSHDNLAMLLGKHGYEVLLRRTHFSRFCLHDLFHRLDKFWSLSFFSVLSRLFLKFFPGLRVRIPTNEMIVIAEKKSA